MMKLRIWLFSAVTVLALAASTTALGDPMPRPDPSSPPPAAPIAPEQGLADAVWVARATFDGTRGLYQITFYHDQTASAVFTDLDGKIIATAAFSWSVQPVVGDHFLLNFGGSPIITTCAWAGSNRFMMFTEGDVWLTFDRQ